MGLSLTSDVYPTHQEFPSDGGLRGPLPPPDVNLTHAPRTSNKDKSTSASLVFRKYGQRLSLRVSTRLTRPNPTPVTSSLDRCVRQTTLPVKFGEKGTTRH